MTSADVDAYISAVSAMTDAERRVHLDHMTDGDWHDHCPACRRRRILGGTGLQVTR